MKKNFKFIIINISFISLIFAFYINQIIPIIKDKEGIENRSIITKPEFDINRLDFYPGEFDSYYTDNFSLRNSFLTEFNKFNKNVFNNHIISGNYIRGEDDFIFPLIRYKQLAKTFKDSHLEMIKNELEYRDSIFDASNRKLMIFIIPTKISGVYDKLPVFFKTNSPSRTQHFKEYIQKNSDLEIYFLEDFFDTKNDSVDLYLKYDTHWNKLGAYWGYNFVSEKVKNYFPEVNTLELSDFIITDTLRAKGDIVKNLGLDLLDNQFVFTPLNKYPAKIVSTKKEYNGSDISDWRGLQTFEVDNKKLPKAMIIRDSFVIFNSEFLKNSFQKSLFIWDKWQYKPHYDIVSDFDPDVVIYLMSEGNIHRFLDEDVSKQYDK